ncbi:MAG: DUF4351 domain-containing protein [Candidatus Tectomicrobia bacterium]|uniref:DUF4351 domain-containing protein n=1 Tax=Tectimicrobiota bacterium TaxID=2528274 RepID=A0A937W6N9_UNCTE|nr:DUF4351 domain-containing protein [Candidatus Tectomicrobia bacterium]
MADHDQRFKVLLQEFFAEFFQLFLPDWFARFDFARIDWLDKEAFNDPPQGERRYLDLVARLPVRQALTLPGLPAATSWLTLVHVEIEADDTAAPLRRRMLPYYAYLRRQYELPVLPIALYLRVGLNGLGWDEYVETFWEQELLRFHYAYIGLPALDGMPYIQGSNWLGVALAALMRIPTGQRLALGQTAWRRLVQCPENDYRKYLLCECVDAYLPLDEGQRRVLETTMLQDPDTGVRTMATTLFEKLREEGREEGRRTGLLEGQRAVIQVLLEERFGPLSASVQAQIEGLPADRLAALGRALLRAQSLRDLGLED